jgi:hypothetical protein
VQNYIKQSYPIASLDYSCINPSTIRKVGIAYRARPGFFHSFPGVTMLLLSLKVGEEHVEVVHPVAMFLFAVAGL